MNKIIIIGLVVASIFGIGLFISKSPNTQISLNQMSRHPTMNPIPKPKKGRKKGSGIVTAISRPLK